MLFRTLKIVVAFLIINDVSFSQNNTVYDNLTIGLIEGNLRSSPNLESEVHTVIKSGDTVTVFNYYSYPFLMVKYDSIIGFISEASINEVKAIDELKNKLFSEENSRVYTTTIKSKKKKTKKPIIKLRSSYTYPQF